MWKRVVIILLLISMIFVFGFWAEKKIKDINFKDFKTSLILPTVTPTPTLRERAKVTRVIDGDTIELSDKRKVRYIGINSPEASDYRGEIKCLAQKSKEANQKLVEGKEVELEKDVSDTDKYNRLLRYVWINDTMINIELMVGGWAESDSYPPDIKYQEIFLTAQKEAKIKNLGIWGKICQ